MCDGILVEQRRNLDKMQLIPLFGFPSLVGVQMRLELHMDITGGVINEDSTTIVLGTVFSFPIANEQATLGLANKVVINGNALSWEQRLSRLRTEARSWTTVVLFARGSSLSLLSELTTGTKQRSVKLSS